MEHGAWSMEVGTLSFLFEAPPLLRIVVCSSLSHLRRHRIFSILSALFICSAASVLIISVSANWR